MKLVTLEEFQKTAALSDSVICWLLKMNSLKMSFDAKLGIQIDVDAPATKSILEAVKRRQAEIIAQNESILGDRFNSLIGAHLDLILERALSIVKAG